jgi:type VI secretion system protein ImpJ
MRQLQPVLWTKGLVLAPQHLQTQDRYFEDQLGFQLASLTRWPWGFSRLRLDDSALAAGTFKILEAAGAFPDGMVFDVPQSDATIPPRTVAEVWTADEATMLVYLAVPEYRLDGKNVVASDGDAQARFRADVMERRDDATGLGARPLQIARKNVRLLLEGEPLEGYSNLPVAKLRRLPSGEVQLDREFVPPLIDFSANPTLALLARRLVELLSDKSATLSGMRRERNLGLAQFSTSDVANFWLLYTVNLHLPVIRHLAETRFGHPVDLFEEMLALAGTLTTFSTHAHPRDFPAYDHLDLGTCFSRLDDLLRTLLATAVPENVVALALREVQDSVHAVALDEDRLLAAPRIYLAVRSQLTKPELMRLVPSLVKISSSERISTLIRQALTGALLTHVANPPSAVPVKLDFEYFEIERNGPEWEAIVRARNLAAYVPTELAGASFELVLLLPQR